MSDILIGKGDKPVTLLAKYGNRHGLVAGATGTGKTITLEVLAEGFSRMGVPVFISDVKGDVSGVALAGTPSDKLTQRAAQVGVENFAPEASPVVFWDLYGKSGHPVRATVSEIGPTLLARIFQLNDTQEGVLQIVFKMADDRGLLLLDLDDLRAVLGFVAENQKDISTHYGLVSTQSISAIQRALVALESDGGDSFFGEPALELADIMRTDMSGRGIVNILAADQLILKPRLYSSFLLWLLSELFETLPEVGDMDKPKLVFFFDEAHLLFNDAPPALLQRVEQVVRLIRSKGVGVYFCSQFPDDMPSEVLGQLGNRVQHALRAYTPRDQKAVKTAAETFVPNPKLDVAQVISQLGVGEALVSTLQEQAIPMPVERTLICPPRCRMGAITIDERNAVRAHSPIGTKYDTRVNRESAYEMLNARKGGADGSATTAPAGTAQAGQSSFGQAPAGKSAAAKPSGFGAEVSEILWGSGRRQGMVEAMAKSTARTVGSQVGRQILRGVLGGIFGGSRR
jgi:uncharacterized protein